jgi:hypothetical protein
MIRAAIQAELRIRLATKQERGNLGVIERRGPSGRGQVLAKARLSEVT